MNDFMKYFLIAVLIWNVITFFMMGIDKHKAKRDKWRIPEKTLLLSAFIMGGFGILCGSACFHHKTQKKKFLILMPIAVLLNAAAIVGLLLWK